MILNFSQGWIEIVGVSSAEEIKAIRLAALRALPGHGAHPQRVSSWRIERGTRSEPQILDYPERSLTTVCCDFELTEPEWRRLLRAICQRLLLHNGYIGLHAVVARLSGQVFAIAGSYGTGKSSIGAVLCERGGELLAGDFAAIGRPQDALGAVFVSGTRPVLVRTEGNDSAINDTQRCLTGMAEAAGEPEKLTAVLYLESNQRGVDRVQTQFP